MKSPRTLEKEGEECVDYGVAEVAITLLRIRYWRIRRGEILGMAEDAPYAFTVKSLLFL